jgi:elongation factor Tu
MEKLIAAMDSGFEIPERLTNKPLLMSIDQAMNISGRGTVCTGTIE